MKRAERENYYKFSIYLNVLNKIMDDHIYDLNYCYILKEIFYDSMDDILDIIGDNDYNVLLNLRT